MYHAIELRADLRMVVVVPTEAWVAVRVRSACGVAMTTKKAIAKQAGGSDGLLRAPRPGAVVRAGRSRSG